MNAPDTIYISQDSDMWLYRRSWFQTRHDDTDIAYVRADLSAYELGEIIVAQKAEIAKLTADLDSWKRQALCEANSLAESNQEIERLREGLREHGNHKRNCEENDEGDDCTCGFTAALKGE